MIAHTQTLTVDNEFGAPGNCMQAVVAALLDLHMEHVPHFALTDDWRRALALWMEGRGKRLRVYTDRHPDAWERANVHVSPLGSQPSGQLIIAAGDSPNGPWSHVVLWRGAEMVHDVHPLRRGLKGEPWEFWQVTDA